MIYQKHGATRVIRWPQLSWRSWPTDTQYKDRPLAMRSGIDGASMAACASLNACGEPGRTAPAHLLGVTRAVDASGPRCRARVLAAWQAARPLIWINRRHLATDPPLTRPARPILRTDAGSSARGRSTARDIHCGLVRPKSAGASSWNGHLLYDPRRCRAGRSVTQSQAQWRRA
jgi:hypothetical protein